MPVQSYSSLNRQKQRTPAKLPEAYTKWSADRSPDNMSSLLSRLKPVINKSLYSYGVSGDPGFETAAKLFLAKEMPKYDPSRGAGLDTFVVSTMRRMPRIIEQRSAAIPVYEGAKLELNRLSAAERELQFELGREPTDVELSDKLSMSTRRIEALRKKYRPTLTDEQYQKYRISDEGGVQDSALAATTFDREKFLRDLLYADLDGVDQRIFEWLYGHNGKPTLKKGEIASKTGLSSSSVTRKAQEIESRLREMRERRFL